MVDLGDVQMPPGYREESLDGITSVVETIAGAGVVPIMLGGDHSIAFADATGVASRRHPA